MAREIVNSIAIGLHYKDINASWLRILSVYSDQTLYINVMISTYLFLALCTEFLLEKSGVDLQQWSWGIPLKFPIQVWMWISPISLGDILYHPFTYIITTMQIPIENNGMQFGAEFIWILLWFIPSICENELLEQGLSTCVLVHIVEY